MVTGPKRVVLRSFFMGEAGGAILGIDETFSFDLLEEHEAYRNQSSDIDPNPMWKGFRFGSR
jgi:hypothetical protein